MGMMMDSEHRTAPTCHGLSRDGVARAGASIKETIVERGACTGALAGACAGSRTRVSAGVGAGGLAGVLAEAGIGASVGAEDALAGGSVGSMHFSKEALEVHLAAKPRSESASSELECSPAEMCVDRPCGLFATLSSLPRSSPIASAGDSTRAFLRCCGELPASRADSVSHVSTSSSASSSSISSSSSPSASSSPSSSSASSSVSSSASTASTSSMA
eukprot:scaffold243365_cov33-Tisochrysis_lutea.AAC.2